VDNIEIYFRATECSDLTQTGIFDGSFENGNEVSGSMKRWEVLV
jgi:hypothetical protein